MNKIWFTSDTHFGSERTLQLRKRPFKSVKEMDEALIDNWNNTVGKDDKVFHLGDFGNYDVIKQLNGKVYLIFGNYEFKDMNTKFKNELEFEKYLKQMGFCYIWNCDEVCYRENIDNNVIYMSHKPSELPKFFTDDEIYNEVHIFGHIHEKQMIKKFGLNVGMDCHNFKPIDLDTVLFYDNALKNFYDEEVFM